MRSSRTSKSLVLFRDAPPHHRRRVRDLSHAPRPLPEASFDVKHAARSALESACSGRNLAQLVVALNAAVRPKLPSDDGAVKKGMALKVSCDRRSCQDVSSSGSHSANMFRVPVTEPRTHHVCRSLRRF